VSRNLNAWSTDGLKMEVNVQHRCPICSNNDTGRKMCSNKRCKLKAFNLTYQSHLLMVMPFSVPDYTSESDTFRVYLLPKLFYELRNACVSDKPGAIGFPVYSIAERELERDIFSFTQGISCKVSMFIY
jgi:hypothetical protein